MGRGGRERGIPPYESDIGLVPEATARTQALIAIFFAAVRAVVLSLFLATPSVTGAGFLNGLLTSSGPEKKIELYFESNQKKII